MRCGIIDPAPLLFVSAENAPEGCDTCPPGVYTAERFPNNKRKGRICVRAKNMWLCSVLLSFLMFSVLAAGSVKSVSAARSVLTVKVGETITLSCREGRAETHRWGGGSRDILSISPRSVSSQCDVTGVRPGTTTVTVSYKYMIAPADPKADAWDLTPDSMSWTIRVVPEDYAVDGALPFAEPAVKRGVVGEDVSGSIDLIGSYNKYSGLVPVRRENLWGFADCNMKLVIPFQFDSVTSNDYHPYLEVAIGKDTSDWCWYLIDKKGNYIIKEGHSGYSVAGDYIRAVRVSNRTEEFFYKTDGTKVSKAEFEKATDGWYRPYEDKFTIGVSPGNSAGVWAFYRQLVDVYVGCTVEEPYVFSVIPPEGLDHPSSKDRNRFFCEDVMVVSRNGRCGAIDKNGKIVIPIEYDLLRNSSGGYMAYGKGDEFGLLKNPVNPPAPAKPSTVTEPSAATKPDTVTKPDTTTKPSVTEKPSTTISKPAALPKVGETVTKRITKRDEEMACGLRAVQLDGYVWGYVDEKDKLVIPCRYKRADTFEERTGLAAVRLDNGKENFIDTSGKTLLPKNYVAVSSVYWNPQALYGFNYNDKGEAVFERFDLKGNPITEDQYHDLVFLPEVGTCVTRYIDYRSDWDETLGLSSVNIDGYMGYVGKGDILVIPCMYKFAGDFREDLKVARVTLVNGKQNLIDLKGNHLLKQNYDSVSETLDGEILAYDIPSGATKTDYLFFNMKGEFLRSVKDVPISKWAQKP